MQSSEDELAVELTANDQFSAVVEDAADEYREAMEMMALQSATASTAMTGVGEAATKTAAQVDTAAEKMKTSWARAGEETRRSGTTGANVLNKMAYAGRAAQQSLGGMQIGAKFAGDNLQKLAQASITTGSKLLQLAASGNYLTLGLLAGTAVWGYFQEKSERALKAAEKAAAEALKAAEKLATEGTRLAAQAAEDQLKASERLAESRLYVENENLTALQNRRNADIAKVGHAEAQKLKMLEERLSKEQELLSKANAAAAVAKSDPEKQAAQEAAASAQTAINSTKAAQADERRTFALQRSKIETEFIKTAEQDSLRLREQSVAVLNRLHEARMKDKATMNEQVAVKVRMLGLDKDALAISGDLERIEGLRRQGRDQEANTLTTLLAIEKAKAQIEKDRDVLKDRVDAAAKLNKEGEKEERRMQVLAGAHGEQRKVLEEVYSVYDRINEKLREGMDFTLASSIYETKKKEILKEYNDMLNKRLATYGAETHALSNQLSTLLSQNNMREQMDAARSRNDASIAVALSDRNKAHEDEVAQMKLYLEYQQEVDRAIAEGDSAHVSALKAQYEIEKQILGIKQQETAEQRTQRQLKDADIAVSNSGLTGTHANKGIRDAWQARNRANREEKLARQARNQGAGFGSRAGDEMGITLGAGEDFNGLGSGRNSGDMGLNANPSKKSNDFPELGPFQWPEQPKDLGAPKLTQGTGEGPQAQLQAVEAQLKEFTEQHRAFTESFKGLGKTLESLPGLEKAIADATKVTESKTGEYGKHVADTQKAAGDLSKTMGDLATASGVGIKDLANKQADLKKRVDDFFKMLEDAKKAGA